MKNVFVLGDQRIIHILTCAYLAKQNSLLFPSIALWDFVISFIVLMQYDAEDTGNKQWTSLQFDPQKGFTCSWASGAQQATRALRGLIEEHLKTYPPGRSLQSMIRVLKESHRGCSRGGNSWIRREFWKPSQ